MNVTADLTRETAIDFLIDSMKDFDICIDCDCDASELERLFEGLDQDIEYFKEKCREFRNEIINKKKKYNKMETHEIYEEGERLGYWKQTEKQRRLV